MLGWLLKPVAAASALAVSTVSLLSRRYERVRLYYHLGLYLTTLGATSVWGVVISIIATAAGQRLNINYYVARSFYGLCSPVVGIKLELEGGEHLSQLATARDGQGQCAVLIGNHQSVLDILYLGRVLPKKASIMAKKELFWTPLLGQFLTLSGAVAVDRSNRQAAVTALEKAGKEMKAKGVSLWVFPEGTRSSSAEPKLLPFKKGAFHLAVQAQVPIIPVVCENYHRLFDGKTRMNQGTLRIKVLPPISTEGLTAQDVSALAQSTHDQMLATLQEISHPGPSGEKARPPSVAEATEPRPSPATSRAVGTADVDVGVEKASPEPSEIEAVDSKDGSDETEDEMDEDAVLLKRPVGVE